MTDLMPPDPDDPVRIPIIMGVLEATWRMHPEYRLGQLLANAAGGLGESGLVDLFYMSDAELLQAVMRMEVP